MAIVILGGLITTMLLTLVGVPAIYLLFGVTAERDIYADTEGGIYPAEVVPAIVINDVTENIEKQDEVVTSTNEETELKTKSASASGD
jgi:hypothetical protein